MRAAGRCRAAGRRGRRPRPRRRPPWRRPGPARRRQGVDPAGTGFAAVDGPRPMARGPAPAPGAAGPAARAAHDIEAFRFTSRSLPRCHCCQRCTRPDAVDMAEERRGSGGAGPAGHRLGDKAVARAQMAAKGTAAVTLRAIAREMGMPPRPSTATSAPATTWSRRWSPTPTTRSPTPWRQRSGPPAEPPRRQGAARLRRLPGLGLGSRPRADLRQPRPGLRGPEGPARPGCATPTCWGGCWPTPTPTAPSTGPDRPARAAALAREVEAFQRRRGGPTFPAPVLAFGLGAWARVHGRGTLEVFGDLVRPGRRHRAVRAGSWRRSSAGGAGGTER